MTTAGWVVVAALAVAVAWLGLALVGAVREIAALRDRVDALEAAGPIHLGSGLPVGASAPAWELATQDGSRVRSSELAGRRYLLVFADAGCAACERLLPAIVEGAGDLPPVVIVGTGSPDELPASWRAPEVVAGAEHDREVSAAFQVEVSPHLFVIDEGGAVVAQGGPTDLDDVRALVRASEGLRIVETADG